MRRRHHVEQKFQTIFKPISSPSFFGNLHKSPGHLIHGNFSGLFVLSVCASASGQNLYPNRRAIFTKIRLSSFRKVRRQSKNNSRTIIGANLLRKLWVPVYVLFFRVRLSFFIFCDFLISGSRERLLNPNFTGKFFALPRT